MDTAAAVTTHTNALLQLGLALCSSAPTLRMSVTRHDARLLPQASQGTFSGDRLELGLFAGHGHV